jgi:hypothetical protein
MLVSFILATSLSSFTPAQAAKPVPVQSVTRAKQAEAKSNLKKGKTSETGENLNRNKGKSTEASLNLNINSKTRATDKASDLEFGYKSQD